MCDVPASGHAGPPRDQYAKTGPALTLVPSSRNLMNGHISASQRPVYPAFLIFSQNLSLALSKHSGSQPEHRSYTEHTQCTLRPVHAGEEIRECLWRSFSVAAVLRRLHGEWGKRKDSHEAQKNAKMYKKRTKKPSEIRQWSWI